VPAGEEDVHVDDVVGADRRVGPRRVGEARLGLDEAEGRAPARRAIDAEEGDVLAARDNPHVDSGDGLLADGAGESVRERAEVIQRIHPSGVYPVGCRDGAVEPDTPGEYHPPVTDTTPTTHPDSHADSFRHSYSRDKAQLVRRLARIEGQVRGISRMIEREEYCVDILQQTAALRAAVDSLAVLVLEDHVQGCVRTAAERGEAEEYVNEVLEVVRRTLGRPVRGGGRA